MNLNNLIFLALEAANDKAEYAENNASEYSAEDHAKIKADLQALHDFTQHQMEKLDGSLTLDDLLPEDEDEPILEQKTPGEPDFILHGDCCWIEVGSYLVYVRPDGDEQGVSVDVTPANDPQKTLDSIHVSHVRTEVR